MNQERRNGKANSGGSMVLNKVIREASLRRQINCSSAKSVLLCNLLKQHSVTQEEERETAPSIQGCDSTERLGRILQMTYG